MKRLLVIGLVLLLLVALGGALFIALFDADRYRPLLVQRMEAALGVPVRLERLRLGWRGGLTLELQGLAVAAGRQGQPTPLFEVGSIHAHLQWIPLFHRRIALSSLTLLKPRLHLARRPDGSMEVAGFLVHPTPALPAGPAGAGPTGAGPAEARSAAPHPQVDLQIQRLLLQEGAVEFTDQTVRPPFVLTVEHLEGAAVLTPEWLELVRLTGRLGKGILTASGKIQGWKGRPIGQLQAQVEGLMLERVLPEPPPGQPRLRGRIGVQAQGRLEGISSADLAQALTGQGRLRLEDGKLENLNILRELFQRLTLIPGLVETLVARLPEGYRRRIEARDTLFKPMDVSLQLQGNELLFQDLRIATDEFELAGSGRLALSSRRLEFPARIRIEPEFSQAVIRSVEELRLLRDAQGRLDLPVLVQGTLPDISVAPDLKEVGARLLTSKGEELVGELLEKLFEKDGD